MIGTFDGEYAFLSNFSGSLIRDAEGIMYPTVEHYFQAMKTLNSGIRMDIARESTPGKAKRAGRQVVLRPDWEDVKLDVMKGALRLKFRDYGLRTKLLATGDEYLEEGNTWHDNFWGVCHCIDCQDKMAHNHLGKLLMEVRDEIRKGEV